MCIEPVLFFFGAVELVVDSFSCVGIESLIQGNNELFPLFAILLVHNVIERILNDNDLGVTVEIVPVVADPFLNVGGVSTFVKNVTERTDNHDAGIFVAVESWFWFESWFHGGFPSVINWQYFVLIIYYSITEEIFSDHFWSNVVGGDNGVWAGFGGGVRLVYAPD